MIGRPGFDGVELAHQVQAGEARWQVAGDDEIKRLLQGAGQAVLAAEDDRRVAALGIEFLFQAGGKTGILVDNQYAGLRFHQDYWVETPPFRAALVCCDWT